MDLADQVGIFWSHLLIAHVHVSGLHYFVDLTKPVGKRIVKVEVLNENATSSLLDPKGWYPVILANYLANGGDNFVMLKDGKSLPSPDPIDVDMLESYFRKHSPLPKPMVNRINFVK